jgi:hypothetical protein
LRTVFTMIGLALALSIWSCSYEEPTYGLYCDKSTPCINGRAIRCNDAGADCYNVCEVATCDQARNVCLYTERRGDCSSIDGGNAQ